MDEVTAPQTATLRLLIEYDGRRFAGWAAQPDQRTVEGELMAALTTVCRRAPERMRVAGRTDAGVSATGQVASVVVSGEVDPGRLRRAINGILPHDLVVREIAIAPDGFDARAAARARAYEYRVLTGVRSPLRRERVLWVPQELDHAAMRAAAALTVGEHDFTAFTPTKTDHVFFDRTVVRCDWIARDDELVFVIEADAFLRHMVRVLVGSMLQVGRGQWLLERFAGLLDGATRSAAGPTAPAHPLTLVAVRDATDPRHPGVERDAV